MKSTEIHLYSSLTSTPIFVEKAIASVLTLKLPTQLLWKVVDKVPRPTHPPSTHAVHTMYENISLVLRLFLAFYTALASAQGQEPLVQPGYKVGERIPVSCLNRTM